MAKGTSKRAKRAGCKRGYYKSRSGALKGRCVKRAQHTTVRGKGRKVLKGAARIAHMCKGNTGSAYKACVKHAFDGVFLPKFKRSRRGRR